MRMPTAIAMDSAKDVRAGGPGSGRHPGFGHGEMKKAVEGLNKRGWMAHPTPNGFNLYHSAYPDRTINVRIDRDGGMRWNHWTHCAEDS